MPPHLIRAQILGGKMEALVESIIKVLGLPEEEKERVKRIVMNNHPRKILVALENAYKLTRRGKRKPTMTLEEFEKMLKKVRF